MEQKDNYYTSQHRNWRAKMTNNYDNSGLILQLKESIRRDFLVALTTKPKGHLAFFIRKGHLSITHEEIRIPLNSMEPACEPASGKGLSRPGVKTLLDMLENALTNIEHIDHGEIQIDYVAAPDGTYVDGNLTIKRAKHFGLH